MNTTIKEIPLLFQTDMVQATIEDRKTQTRRTKGLEGLNNHYFQSLVHHAYGHFTFVEIGNHSPTKEDVKVAKCPYGKPGDLLWVRETWLKMDDDHIGSYSYKATIDLESDEIRKDYIRSGRKYQWKPSIHMPKAAARLWLMVEEIRVERLQDISEKDAVAEGIESQFIHLFQELRYRCYSSKNKTPYQGFPQHWASNWREPISSFQSLWISINGQASWDANLWVWVVKFRVLSTTGRPSDEVIEQNWKEVTQ